MAHPGYAPTATNRACATTAQRQKKFDGGPHISRRGAVSWFFHHHQNTKRITLPFSLGFRCYVGVLMMAPVFPVCHREFPCPRQWFAVVCSAW